MSVGRRAVTVGDAIVDCYAGSTDHIGISYRCPMVQTVILGGRKMADVMRSSTGGATDRTTSHAYQAYQILHLAFIVAPIVAGLDKYLHFLRTDWHQYLAPRVSQILGRHDQHFMFVVGAIEILAGLLVAIKPRIGGYIVTVWLWGIVVNLLMIPGYYDVVLRDLCLSLGALALARLSHEFSR